NFCKCGMANSFSTRADGQGCVAQIHTSLRGRANPYLDRTWLLRHNCCGWNLALLDKPNEGRERQQHALAVCSVGGRFISDRVLRHALARPLPPARIALP